jgi:hypothetical protein
MKTNFKNIKSISLVVIFCLAVALYLANALIQTPPEVSPTFSEETVVEQKAEQLPSIEVPRPQPTVTIKKVQASGDTTYRLYWIDFNDDTFPPRPVSYITTQKNGQNEKRLIQTESESNDTDAYDFTLSPDRKHMLVVYSYWEGHGYSIINLTTGENFPVDVQFSSSPEKIIWTTES